MNIEVIKMDPQREALNLTEAFAVRYPVANMIFHNKTLIFLARRHISNNQQIALLIGMAFIGGIVAGFLVRFLYYNIVKYFMRSMDQIESPSTGNANPSFVDDSFYQANDQPPDYVTVMTDSIIQSNSVQQGYIHPCKERRDSKIPEENPPAYISIVASIGRVIRSASA